jgi:hypothetical protein
MTKATKERMLLYLEEHLAYFDLLIDLNMGNEDDLQSLEEEYEKLLNEMIDLRDLETTD